MFSDRMFSDWMFSDVTFSDGTFSGKTNTVTVQIPDKKAKLQFLNRWLMLSAVHFFSSGDDFQALKSSPIPGFAPT